MKIYQITLENGQQYEVQGDIMVISDKTGQIIIYSKPPVTFTNIAAIVPSSAFVAVVPESNEEGFICPCCESDKTYKTNAYHCTRCAITTEV